MNQQETKLELLEKLEGLNEKYLVIRVDFRTKQTNDGLEITEFFTENVHTVHGYCCPELLWEWYEMPECIHIGEYLNRVGFYSCTMVFTYDSDGDDYRTWTWLVLDTVRIDNFTPLEVRLNTEYEMANIVLADCSPDDESPYDDLPF